MFPISFPVNDNVTSLLKKNTEFDFMSLFKTIVSSGEYSYLNIDKPSTVIQVIWLDTIATNPVYMEIYEALKNYKKKLIEYALVKIKRTDTKNINGIKDDLVKIFDKHFKTPDLKRKKKEKELNFKKKLSEFDTTNDRIKILNDLIQLLRDMMQTSGDNTMETELDSIDKRVNVNTEDTDKTEIEKVMNLYKKGKIDETALEEFFKDYKNHSSTWWKVYFMLRRLKKYTTEYNDFIEKYVARFVTSRETDWYYNSRSANEGKFLKSTTDLEFYFDFLKKIEQFIPPYRKSLSVDISRLLGDDDNRYTINIDEYLKLYKKQNIDAGIDVIRPSKKTKSENEVANDTKNDYYEIHVGIAVVGGKINSNTNVWCYYNSIKLASDFTTIYDSIKLASAKQEVIDTLSLYPYVDLEAKIAEADAKATVKADAKPMAKPIVKADAKPMVNTQKKGGSKKTARKTLRLKK
jgi:hypothetical protein